MSSAPHPLDKWNASIVGTVKSAASLQRFLIGQIKLTRIHVLSLFLPGVRVKRDKEASLYDVERSGRGAFAGTTQPNLLFSRDVYSVFAVVSPGNGGARRDRTDDILLAKQALSQLSYGPITET